MSFKHYLSEKFLNLFPQDTKSKEKFKDEVYRLLQKAYEPIGGLKGSGFGSPDEMVKEIPLWKLAFKDGVLKAVMLYKDKHGRKSVASGTDGSDEGKLIYKNMAKHEGSRAYGEVSGGALITRLKANKDLPIIPIEKVKEISSDEIIPISDFGYEKLTDSDKKLYELLKTRFPDVFSNAYVRNLGGEMKLKVMVGTPFLTVDKK